MTYNLYQGDCLTTLQTISDSSFDLVYLDPPFFTQKIQKQQSRDQTKMLSYRDIWASFSEYIQFLVPRLQEISRVLKPTGTIFFHCDRNASHVVRALLDQVFGEKMFRSEIIWHYRRWTNEKKAPTPAHQTIYFYSKTDTYTYHTLYQEYSPTTNIDQILQKRERNDNGKTIYARDEHGDVVYGIEKKGVPLNDVWDIPYLNPKAKERTGYPTQKPVILLERIIQLCTNQNDWVLDPFCGSGTTLVAATIHKRNAVGIDISEDALAITRNRLEKPIRTESLVLQKGRDTYQADHSDLLALLSGIDYVPVQRNKGIDAVLRQQINGYPIPLRIQRRGETIQEAAAHLYNAGKTKNAPIMILIKTRADEPTNNETLPPKIMLIEAPAASIQQQLAEMDIPHISTLCNNKPAATSVEQVCLFDIK